MEEQFEKALLKELEELRRFKQEAESDFPYSSHSGSLCKKCRYENGRRTYTCSTHIEMENLRTMVGSLSSRLRAYEQIIVTDKWEPYIHHQGSSPEDPWRAIKVPTTQSLANLLDKIVSLEAERDRLLEALKVPRIR